ncbi:MAG: transcription termination factor NusA, partial [bacterium]
MKRAQSFNLVQSFEDLIKEKGLNAETVETCIREAILQGVKKRFGHAENFRVEIDINQGKLELIATKSVVKEVSVPSMEILLEEAKKVEPNAKLGDSVEVPVELESLGRNAIYFIRERLIEKLREVERDKVYHDFQHKKGEIVTGTVQRIQRGDIIVNLGRTEGIIPRSEQIPQEKYQQGRPIRAYVLDVKNDPKSPQIILSRRSPEFLKKLFEFEVPEIYEGRVEIVRIAREAGERSKVAVMSVDGKIDPVGACVGLKGIRVQAVVKELNNEKIDVIPYETDPEKFVASALAPANVLLSEVYPEEKRITVVVED